MKTKHLLSLLLFCSGWSATRAQVMLSESFNVSSSTNTPPPGWTVSSTGTTNGCYGIDWEQVPSGGFSCPNNGAPQPTPTANSGSGMAGYNSWDIVRFSASNLITPALNFSGLGSHTVSYYVFEQWGFSNNDSLRVLINTSPSLTGATLLAEHVPNYFPPNSYGWSQYTINIPTTFTGTTNYIIFRGVSDYGYDVFLDDVEVTKIPPTPCSGTPQTPSITNTIIAPATPICSGGTRTLTATDPNLPLTSGITYQWESGPSATGPWTAVTGGTGATTLNYTTAPLTTTTWFRMALICAASTTTVYTGTYEVPVGSPQPSPVQGPPTICPGDAGTFSVTAAAGTTYAWTLPTGWTGTSTTNSITATAVTPAGPGTISVTASSSCGVSIPQTITVNPGAIPQAPAAISGLALFCPNTPQTYTVPAVSGATSYQWTLPAGWTGTSTTNSITVTTTSTGGTIAVRAANGCGQGIASSLTASPIVALDPITTIFGSDTLCAGALSRYYIRTVPGATSYNWTLPTGWSGTFSDTSAQIFPNGTTGTISVTAQVSCAITAPATKLITVAQVITPSVSIAAPTGTLCSGKQMTITATPVAGGTAPSYQWYRNGAAVVMAGPNYVSSTLAPGDALQVIMTSNDRCASPLRATSNLLTPNITPSVIPGVSINSVPGDVVCTGTPMDFTSISTGGGNGARYQWMVNGVDVTNAVGTTFSAANLRNGDTVTVMLVSDAICRLQDSIVSNKLGVDMRDTLIPGVTVAVTPDNVIEPGEELTFTATPVNGGLTPTYQWFRNGMPVPFETNATFTTTALKGGDHITVRMLSYLSCAYPPVAYSNAIILDGADLGVGPQSPAGSFGVYPNPSRGSLHLKADLSGMKSGGLQVEIMNTLGQIVHRVLYPSASGAAWHATIELPAQLSSGQYLLHIRNSEVSGEPLNVTRQFQLIR